MWYTNIPTNLNCTHSHRPALQRQHLGRLRLPQGLLQVGVVLAGHTSCGRGRASGRALSQMHTGLKEHPPTPAYLLVPLLLIY